jgi:hypothetical protein
MAQTLAPPVDQELPPGARRDVDLQIAGPSVLIGSVRWIGTLNPLTVTLSLGTSQLATGADYHFGSDRGGAFLRARTASAGVARLSVTNTSGVAVRVRILFAFRAQ